MAIVEIEDYREVWLAGLCVCVACSALWEAVVHEDKRSKLECPECGEYKGALINVYTNSEDE